MMKRFNTIIVALMLACLVPGLSWGAAVHCNIDTGGALPFSSYTKEQPIAVAQNTPDNTVILSLDYGQFLPNMHLSCSTDGQNVPVTAGFSGLIYMYLNTVNGSTVSLTGEIPTANSGVTMKLYIKAISYNQEIFPDGVHAVTLNSGMPLNSEHAIVRAKEDTQVFEFGAQYSADKTQYQFSAAHNYAVQSMRVELIKKGTLDYGGQAVIAAGSHLTFAVDGLSGVNTVDIPLGSGVYLGDPSCTLDKPHESVSLGSFNKRSDATYPLEGNLKRFGIGFTCSSYANNVEFTFTDANAQGAGQDLLVVSPASGGMALGGVGIGMYDSEGKRITMGAKQQLGAFNSGPNTAWFQAAIVQTAPNITGSRFSSFTGSITAKANLEITYY